MTNAKDVIVDLSFTPDQLESMLKNARLGGLVSVKVQLNIEAAGKVVEVILR